MTSDAWTDRKSSSLIFFLVNSPKGAMFIRSIATSGIIKNVENLYKLLDDVVKEIGKKNIVQVITDSASTYVGTSNLLEEKLKNLF